MSSSARARRLAAAKRSEHAARRKAADLNRELAAKVRARPSSHGIRTAAGYVQTLLDCSAGMCPDVPARVKTLKRANNTLVYGNDETVVIKAVTGKPKGAKADQPAESGAPEPILSFDLRATSSKRDRDGDYLHPEGARVDPRLPLLWQHNPVQPIGKMMKFYSQDKNEVLMNAGIYDTPLGQDAAYLAKCGVLRFSHGFRPLKYAPLPGATEDDPGFEVFEYEMMELSLVSVPSNTDAEILGFTKGVFKSPEMKAFGQKMYWNRPVIVPGWSKNADPVPQETQTAKGPGTMDELAKMIGECAATIKHSGKSGQAFMKMKGDDANPQADVLWNCSKEDIAEGAKDADGNPYTGPDEIKNLFKAVKGVDTVQVAAEMQPEWNTGWHCAFPEDAKGVWGDETAEAETEPKGDAEDEEGAVETAAEEDAEGAEEKPKEDQAKGKGAANAKGNAPKPASLNTHKTGAICGCTLKAIRAKGKAAAAKTGKAKTPVTVKGVLAVGSGEHIAAELEKVAGEYLTASGIKFNVYGNVRVVSVYATGPGAGYVIVGVGVYEYYYSDVEQASVTYYQIGYATDASGNPAFSGLPQEVLIRTTFVPVGQATETPAPAAGTAGDTGTAQTQDQGSTGASGAGSGSQTGTAGVIGVDDGKAGHPKSGNPRAAGTKNVGGLQVKKMKKKHASNLKEADEVLDAAAKAGELKAATKALLMRGSSLVKEVLDDDAKGDDGTADDANPMDPTLTGGVNGKSDDADADDAKADDLTDETQKAWDGRTKTAWGLLRQTVRKSGVKAEGVVSMLIDEFKSALSACSAGRDVERAAESLLAELQAGK